MDFDWVKARSECNAYRMFLQLLSEAQEDAKIATELLKGSGKLFLVKPEAASFVVFENTLPKPRRVSFALNETHTSIYVRDEQDEEKFTISVRLNENRQCACYIGNEQLENWQVRQRALETLFFPLDIPKEDWFANFGGQAAKSAKTRG